MMLRVPLTPIPTSMVPIGYHDRYGTISAPYLQAKRVPHPQGLPASFATVSSRPQTHTVAFALSLRLSPRLSLRRHHD